MTTVAWRDGVMAADTLMIAGNVKSRGRKLTQLRDGRVVGISGGVTLGYRFVSALKANKKPDFTADECDNFNAIVMLPDGSLVEYEDGKTPLPIIDKFYAIGSGSMAALAAMHMGADAREAVRIAALVDAATGGPIQIIHAKRKTR